jgi:hypothetical protein
MMSIGICAALMKFVVYRSCYPGSVSSGLASCAKIPIASKKIVHGKNIIPRGPASM